VTQPETEIRNAWRHIAGTGAGVDGFVDDLLGRYREPHRRYHTAVHIMWVLRHVGDLTAHPSPALVAAALYHDAVYDALADDNEARSADLARADLGTIGWTAPACTAVASMILATAHRADPGPPSTDTALLLDADLAILGAEPQEYSAYVTGVRAEYSHVSDEQWRAGRSAVLQHFLDRPRLFITEAMHSAGEHRARANMQAELADLAAAGDRRRDQ
jgi:predicted metal-dependent HD superfamily phosphohydrolase